MLILTLKLTRISNDSGSLSFPFQQMPARHFSENASDGYTLTPETLIAKTAPRKVQIFGVPRGSRGGVIRYIVGARDSPACKTRFPLLGLTLCLHKVRAPSIFGMNRR